jgi:hypothetical protein
MDDACEEAWNTLSTSSAKRPASWPISCHVTTALSGHPLHRRMNVSMVWWTVPTGRSHMGAKSMCSPLRSLRTYYVTEHQPRTRLANCCHIHISWCSTDSQLCHILALGPGHLYGHSHVLFQNVILVRACVRAAGACLSLDVT